MSQLRPGVGLGGVNRIAGQRIRRLKSKRISGLAGFENTADCVAAAHFVPAVPDSACQ